AADRGGRRQRRRGRRSARRPLHRARHRCRARRGHWRARPRRRRRARGAARRHACARARHARRRRAGAMSRAGRAVERLWDAPGFAARAGRLLLTPAAGLYAAGIGIRNAAYGVGVLRAGAAPARTVSIGNLRVGGTGKTPLTRWLAQQTAARGVATAILTRGYGGSAREPHVVGDGATLVSDVPRSGDEAVMLARTAG